MPNHSTPDPRQDALDSWKEIAAYLGRDVSTAKRWETSRNLPVHRIPGGKRGAVYALKSELDAWRLMDDGSAHDTAEAPPPSSLLEVLRRRALPISLGAALVAALGISAWLWLPRTVKAPLRFAPLASLPGDEVDPALSGDGNYVAFAYRPVGAWTYSIYLAQTGGGQPIRLTATPAQDRFPQFSPDSARIAFIRVAGPGAGVWMMQTFGGGERKICDLAWTSPPTEQPLAWSPDGQFLVVADEVPPSKVAALHSIHIATGARMRLTHPPPGTFGDAQPAWLANGGRIAFLRQAPSRIREIWITPASGGTANRITFDQRDITGLASDPSGKRLLYLSDRGGPDPALWSIPSGGGTPELLTTLPRYSRNLAVSTKTGRVAYTRHLAKVGIWRHDVGGAGDRPENLISSSGLQSSPEYSPDGTSIAFMSDRNGWLELWVARADGSDPRQLTWLHGEGGAPRWSPDGRQIAFDVRTQGHHEICSVSAGGATLRHLVADAFENGAPSWSRDGAWLYFGSNRGGTHQVWKVSAEGGTPSQVTRGGGMIAFESTDGSTLYYSKRAGNGLWRKSLPEGDETPLPGGCARAAFGAWRVDAHGVVCLDFESRNGVPFSVLRRWPNPSGPIQTLFAIAEPRILPGGPVGITAYHPISLSPDGKSLLLARIEQSQSNIMFSNSTR